MNMFGVPVVLKGVKKVNIVASTANATECRGLQFLSKHTSDDRLLFLDIKSENEK